MSRCREFVPALLLATGWLAGCATTAHVSPAEIEAVERARFAAWITGDRAAIEPLLADDLVYCHSNGRCETKSQLLTSMTSGAARYVQIDVLSLNPRVVDANTAIVQGTAALKVEANGQPLAFNVSYTDVYVRRNGRWLLTAWQSTRLAE